MVGSRVRGNNFKFLIACLLSGSIYAQNVTSGPATPNSPTDAVQKIVALPTVDLFEFPEIPINKNSGPIIGKLKANFSGEVFFYVNACKNSGDSLLKLNVTSGAITNFSIDPGQLREGINQITLCTEFGERHLSIAGAIVTKDVSPPEIILIESQQEVALVCRDNMGCAAITYTISVDGIQSKETTETKNLGRIVVPSKYRTFEIEAVAIDSAKNESIRQHFLRKFDDRNTAKNTRISYIQGYDHLLSGLNETGSGFGYFLQIQHYISDSRLGIVWLPGLARISNDVETLNISQIGAGIVIKLLKVGDLELNTMGIMHYVHLGYFNQDKGIYADRWAINPIFSAHYQLFQRVGVELTSGIMIVENGTRFMNITRIGIGVSYAL